jgi:hypothetical protein
MSDIMDLANKKLIVTGALPALGPKVRKKLKNKIWRK